jgi:hypothetical protein
MWINNCISDTQPISFITIIKRPSYSRKKATLLYSDSTPQYSSYKPVVHYYFVAVNFLNQFAATNLFSGFPENPLYDVFALPRIF